MSNFDALNTYSKKKLKAIVEAEEHNEFEGEDGDWIHAHWDCEACEAEKVLSRRRHLKESKKPGRCSAIYIPGVQTATSKNVSASELKVGYQARYLSKPGSSDYPFEYAEIVSIERHGKKLHIEWRRTNTDPDAHPSFTADYKLNDSVNVCYATPLKAK